ncbi:phosphohistidine phosphatase SixA [Thermodesulfobacteriota bacterium]
MKLYLMQHGKPLSKDEDPERPLSDQGAMELRKMAEFLEKCGIRVGEVLHSGKTRARQTAEIMISKLNPGAEPVGKDYLSPLDDVKDIGDQIKEREDDLMIAGHLPHLSKLTSLLVTGSESTPVVAYQQGGVVCLSRDKDGNWTVAWMLVPEII